MVKITTDDPFGLLDTSEKADFDSTKKSLEELKGEQLFPLLVAAEEAFFAGKSERTERLFQIVASEMISKAQTDDSVKSKLEEYVNFQHDRGNLQTYRQLWNGSFISDQGYAVFTLHGASHYIGPSTLFLEKNFFRKRATSYHPKDFSEIFISLMAFEMAFRGKRSESLDSRLTEMLQWIPELANDESDKSHAAEYIQKFLIAPKDVLAMSKIADYDLELAAADKDNILPDGSALRFVKKYVLR